MKATASRAEHWRRSWLPARPAGGLVPAGTLDLGWAVLCLPLLAAMVAIPGWQLVPCSLIWTFLIVRCGVRRCPVRRAVLLAAAAAAATAAAAGSDVARGLVPDRTLAEAPVLAAMFAVTIWAVWRGQEADGGRLQAAQAGRLLAAQRQFLQDTSHQLKTPITIALGHAELLAGQLSSMPGQRDIHVVVGELERLRTLSERLLLIAASENPEFLRTGPVELELLAADLLLRWRPAAPRRWALGRLDPVQVQADSERLRLAIDALLENAVQHTAAGDAITLSVVRAGGSGLARIAVEDSGEGIRPGDIPHIFDRFRTAGGGQRGTGLGLALVQAIARGHDGEVRVTSTPGEGSRFELLLPICSGTTAGQPAGDRIRP